MGTTTRDELLEAWFGRDLDSPERVGERSRLWFGADPAFDDLLRGRFAELPDRALAGELEDWGTTAHATLARALVLDQLPRNLHRGTARAFAYDAAALDVSLAALSCRLDDELHPLEAVFLYLPFEHAEDRALQARSVSLFRKLGERAPAALAESFGAFLEYAERHRAVVEKFGRFPHRNAILARPSSEEERAYLESGGDTF